MSKDIAFAPNPSGNIPSPEEMKTIINIVQHLVDSKYLEKIGGVSQGVAIALYAREMGLPLMSSLFGGIRPVLGRVEIAPQMMNAMIRRAGHRIETIHLDDTRCELVGTRKDTGEKMTSVFTIDDAKKANIYKGPWITYPKNMLYKSAISNLGRWHFADVIGMAGVEGEFHSDESDYRHKTKIEPISNDIIGAAVPPKLIESVSAQKPDASDEMTIQRFQESLRDTYDFHCVETDLKEYIELKKNERAEKGKPVTEQNIMLQALQPALGERFINGFKNWLDAKHDSMEVSE